MEKIIEESKAEIVRLITSGRPTKEWIRRAKVLIKIIGKLATMESPSLGKDETGDHSDFMDDHDDFLREDNDNSGFGQIRVAPARHFNDPMGTILESAIGVAQPMLESMRIKNMVETKRGILYDIIMDLGRSEDERKVARDGLNKLSKFISDPIDEYIKKHTPELTSGQPDITDTEPILDFKTVFPIIDTQEQPNNKGE